MSKRLDTDKMADEEIIVGFFAGDGTTAPHYPEHNSQEEKNARAALARRVRDSMPGFSGELLALAIDPGTPSRFIGMKPLRTIKFESPARGKPSTWRRDLRIADFIRNEIGRTAARDKDGVPKPKMEAAIHAAAEKFGVSRATAQAIWKRHQVAMEDARKRELGASK